MGRVGEVRTCQRCGWSGPIVRKDGRWACRACGRQRAKERYRADPQRERAEQHRQSAVARNRAFITALNSRTICAHCGAQPIEWHNPEHVEMHRERYRIGHLVAQGNAIETIEAELARCTPLCRPCHMQEDGRLNRLRKPGPPKRVLTRAAEPCASCTRPYMPLRRGLCSRCYNRDFRRHWRKKVSLSS